MIRLLILAWAALAGQAGAAEIRAEDLGALPPADVVILGEIHDNPVHHDNQARAVAAIAPAALVFEMLTPAQAAKVPQDRTDGAALARILDWEASGWPDFAMYHPIFTAAPGARIYGANVPRSALGAAMEDGAAAAFGDDAARFGLTTPLPAAEQAAREAEQQEAHCNALPADLLPGMVAAQRVRDAALARAAEAAFAETGGPVVVITGSGHARRDWGVPAALDHAAPALRVLSVGQMEAAPGPDAPFDLWIVTDPAPRPDPCAGFAVQGG